MNVIVSLEHRFARTPDGGVWTQTAFAYRFWERYLTIFDHVRVLARVQDVPTASLEWERANGKAVSFIAVPYYLGPWEYLTRLRRIRRVVLGAVGPEDAVILRLSSPIASALAKQLYKRGQPYGVEVVGDPYDVFAPGVVEHPLRPAFRWWFTRQLKRQCAAACTAAYVTEQMLQRRYPNHSYSVGVSDVELSEAAFVSAPRLHRRPGQVFNLITVGSLAQLYKAPDVLIDAVASCIQAGLELNLMVIGDGKYRPDLEARARALGIADRVRFLGQLPAGDAVRAQLDQADIFVLPSRTEGLPRAMIEAMARGLPCIGTTVGGIPELLPPEDLVPPSDAAALARIIGEVVRNRARMARMSARNLEHAQAYQEDVLHARRIAFYGHVREQTEAWLIRRGCV